MKKVISIFISLIFVGVMFYSATNMGQIEKVNAIETLKKQVTNTDDSDPWNPGVIVTCDPGGNGCLPSGG